MLEFIYMVRKTHFLKFLHICIGPSDQQQTKLKKQIKRRARVRYLTIEDHFYKQKMFYL